MSERKPLPESWINKIFDHMSASYGSKFSDLWRGADIASVRSLWAEKLGGFRDMPEAIKEALDALDSKPFPPTLPEFIALCRESGRRHVGNVQAIEYKPTIEEQEKARAAAKSVANAAANFGCRDPRKWISDLNARAEKGEKLSAIQEQWIRDAERVPVGVER